MAAHYVTWLKIHRHILRVECRPNNLVFTALHAMQTRYCDENSVRLSVTRVIYDKMEESSVQIYRPYERTFISLL